MAKEKNIRRSLGLGKIYNIRKMSQEIEDNEETRSFSDDPLHLNEDRLHSEDSAEDLVPPEVPERDYEVLQFDYIPPSNSTPSRENSPSRDTSPNSTLDETISSNFSCSESASSSSSWSTLRLKNKKEKSKFSLARTLFKTFSHNT